MKKLLFAVFILSLLLGVGSAARPAGNNLQFSKQIGPPRAAAQVPGLKPLSGAKSSGLKIDYGSLPLYFTANKGQVDGKALFYAKASRYTLWLTEEGLIFDSFKSEKAKDGVAAAKAPFMRPEERSEDRKYARDVSRLVFLNANKHPEIVGVAETALKVNYFIGNDPEKWHTAVPTSEAVLYKNIYDRIDLKVYGTEGRIEYDWIVRPGGNPSDIKFEYRNVKGTWVDEEGNLLVETSFGELMHKRPEAYQEAGIEAPAEDRSRKGKRAPIESAFKKIGEDAYGFEVGEYDASRELVIDPVILAYSTYLGGSNTDYSRGIAVDGSGNAYVTGYTDSTNFPTLNQYQADRPGTDVFVTKIDTTKSGNASLVYSTYLGGSSSNYGNAIAVDGSGNAYVTGYTSSSNFPTLNQYQTYQTGDDAFVTRLDTTKSGNASLVYSTYLGGNDRDYGYGIVVDNSSNAYVTGETFSTNFPTLNQYQTDRAGYDAFVTRLDTTKSGNASLIFSTYLGGSGSFDEAYGIAVDGSGNAYVTGHTNSTDFPTLNQYMTDQVNWDVFVTKIDTTKSGNACLIYSTYLGGNGSEFAYGIAVDGSGNAYVTGCTASNNFPTLNEFQKLQGSWDVFITKIDTTKSGNASLVYSTYLGGNDMDYGYGIAADGNGFIYITGYTASTNFPTLNHYQADPGDANRDVFVVKFDTTKSGNSSLVFSTYLGGNGSDTGYGIAVDSSGAAYVAGNTGSTNFPTLNQYQLDQAEVDAFITKIRSSTDIGIVNTTDNLTPKVGEDFHFTITATNNGPMGATGLKIADVLPAALTYQTDTPSKGAYNSGTGIWNIDVLAVGESATLTIGVRGTTAGAVTNTASISALNEADPDTSNDSASASVTVKNALTIIAGAGGATNPVPGTYLYDQGAAVSISATAGAGYRFGSWSGDASGTTSPVSVTMNGNRTVTAEFIRQYTLTFAAGAGGTTNPAPGAHIYDEGTSVSIQASPSAGYRFLSWSGDASGTTNPASVTMNGDKTVTAAFQRQYTLTVAAGGGGTTNPAPGAHVYDEGASASIQATAAAGYRFLGWSGDASGTANPAAVTMNGDKTVTAAFQRQYALTVAAGSGGTTNPAPGTHIYDEGASVSIQATAAAGYRFLGWSGDASGTANPSAVTMNGDKTFTASFQRQYTLTIAAGAGGNTNPVPGTYTYDEGTSVSLQATAAGGYRFVSWSGDASGSANTVSVTMNSNKNVFTSFVRQFTLTISAGVGGTTDPAPGAHIYDEGTSVSIQATASAGYRFLSWSGDASGTANPAAVTMNGDKTVTAAFQRQYTLTVAAGVGGTTNPAPGTHIYDEGASVSIQATAASGYRFLGWSGDASGTANPASVAMNGDRTLMASFQRQYTLTIAAGAGGNTNPVPGTYTYDEGTSVSLQATAAGGYRFGSWSGDVLGSANNVSVTLNSNKNVSASFIRQFTLTIAAGAGGTTNPAPGAHIYDEGTSVSIQASPSAGYRFLSWSGDASGTTNPASVTMNGDKTVTAAFQRQYTLTVAAGVGGTTNPAPGAHVYDEGASASIQATAAAGYRFLGWNGDASGTANPAAVTMNGDKTITASFQRQYILTIAAGAGGNTNPVPGTYTYDEGTSVSLQATAAGGYRFGSWSGDASGSANSVSVTMNSNKNVSASFIRQFALTIAAGAGGTTNPAPGAHIYDEGTSVSVQATAAAGYRFLGWSGDASGTANPAAVTMNGDKTVTASFQRQYTLTIAAGTGGTTNPALGAHVYDEGALVSIQATAASGYRFLGWSGDALGTANPASVTMNGDKMLTASFQRQYTLTIAANGGGTTTPAPGTHIYDEGTSVTIEASAPGGYRLDGWTGDFTGRANPITLVMNANKSVAVSFIREYSLTIIAGPGGTTNPAPGVLRYDEGTTVSLQAAPAAGYRFGAWSGDAAGTANPVSITMTSNKTVSAAFVRQYTLTIAASSGGSTNPAPGTFTYDAGTSIAVQAIPQASSLFEGWSGDATGMTNPLPLVMDGNKAISANFSSPVQPPLNLIAEKITNRTVSHTETVVRLRWQVNGANEATVKYRVYRIDGGQAVPIAEVGPGAFEYIVRNLQANGVYRFGVSAISTRGAESARIEVAVQ